MGTVYGWIFAAHQVGAALAAWGGGVARDALGTYTLVFLLAEGLGLGAALLSLGLRRPAALAS